MPMMSTLFVSARESTAKPHKKAKTVPLHFMKLPFTITSFAPVWEKAIQEIRAHPTTWVIELIAKASMGLPLFRHGAGNNPAIQRKLRFALPGHWA
jgi:hypothetical protein